jgi:hypothetical protein
VIRMVVSPLLGSSIVVAAVTIGVFSIVSKCSEKAEMLTTCSVYSKMMQLGLAMQVSAWESSS